MSSLLALLTGLLVGGIQLSPWLTRRLQGIDLRAAGSGNLGATNALRTAGPRVAIPVFLVDALKGFLSVGLLIVALRQGWLAAPDSELFGESYLLWLGALGAVTGHIFPWSYGFRGGKGVATASGALVLLSPLALLGSFLLFAALVGWSHRVSLGSLAAALSLPVLTLATGDTPWGSAAFLLVVLIAMLVTFAHRGNIARLLSGTEPAIRLPGDEASGSTTTGSRRKRRNLRKRRKTRKGKK